MGKSSKAKIKAGDTKVEAKIAKVLADAPEIAGAAKKAKDTDSGKGAPFSAPRKTIAKRAGSLWEGLVDKLRADRQLTEAEVAWCFEETARRHATMSPTIEQLKGTFNEVVLGCSSERCANRTLVEHASLVQQMVEVVRGGATFYCNVGLPPGGLADVPPDAGLRLTLDDLLLTPRELAAARKRMPKQTPGMDFLIWNQLASAEAERLADILVGRLVHVRDAEIDGLEFFDMGALLPLKDDMNLLVASEEYKTVLSGKGGQQSAVRANRIFRPEVSEDSALRLIRTSNTPISQRARQSPERATAINTTVGRLLLPTASQGIDQTLVKATTKGKDAASVQFVRRGSGLVDRKRELGEVMRRGKTVELTIFRERMRMPGAEIEDVFEALRRDP
jgi:hypothetical protein